MLIERLPDCAKLLVNQRGKTALMHAIEGSHLATVECLVELGADLNVQDAVSCLAPNENDELLQDGEMVYLTVMLSV